MQLDRLFKEFAHINSGPIFDRVKGRFSGEKCVLIGNGPSLNKMDLSFLKDHYTIGQNKIYMLLDKLNIETDFLVVINPKVARQSAGEIPRLGSLKFLEERALDYIPFQYNTIYLRSVPEKFFSVYPKTGFYNGHTVTYTSMQIAFFLGFTEVYLIGVDHYFKAMAEGKPDQEIIRDKDDLDHFDPNYFAKGVKWDLPNLEESENAYRMAKAVYEANGRKIYDATVDGHLQVFEKKNYQTLINHGLTKKIRIRDEITELRDDKTRISFACKSVKHFINKYKLDHGTGHQKTSSAFTVSNALVDLYTGITFFQINDFEKSQKFLKKAIRSKELQPAQLSLALQYLGENSIKSGNKRWQDQFIKAIDVLTNLKKKSLKDYYWIASVYKRLGDYTNSEKWFKKLLKRGSKKPKLLAGAYYHLGEIYLINHKKELGRKYFKKCLQFEANHKKAQDFLDKINDSQRT